MKTIAAILAVALCVTILLGGSPVSRPVSSTQPVFPSTQPVDASDVESVTVWPPPTATWFLTIRADGSAHIQYGSSAGDDARLPKGTFDFKMVVAEVLRQQSAEPVRNSTHAGLDMKGRNSTTLAPLKDDTYFRKLIVSVNGKWQDKGWRFDQLREKYPIYAPPAGGER